MEMLKSVRQTVRDRDGADNLDITEMFEEFGERFSTGEDPEELLSDIFGLEPDYIMDREVMEAMS